MFLKKVFIIHGFCELITNYLKNDLLSEGFFYEEKNFDNYIRDSLGIVKYSDRIHSSNLIICYPITFRSVLLLLLSIFIKPRRLIYIVPPSIKHSQNNLLFKFKKYLFKTILTLINTTGVEQLLVFTTPYEKILLENIIRKTNYVYYPTYFVERPELSELISFDKLKILYFIEDSNDLSLINGVVSVLEELGLKPLVVINCLERGIYKCIDDYRVICIHSYEYDELIKQSTIVIVKTPSPESNSIILKSIVYNRPVITTHEHGLAIYYNYVNYIYLQKKWTHESLASNILEILSNIDELKRKFLSTSIDILNNRFGKYVITKFLIGEM